MSIATLQLLQAFNLGKIAEQAYLIRKEEESKEQEEKARLTVVSVMSENGFALAELFGFHLARQLSEPLAEIAKRKGLIRANSSTLYSTISA